MADRNAARTLKSSVTVEGIGLHSGRPVRMTLSPAPAGTGILFRRRDLLDNAGPAAQPSGLERITVAASPMNVSATTLGTVISNRHGVTVSTIEHIMSAFAGCGIDHAIVDLDGPEVPIMDGSSAPFVDAIERVGRRALPASRRLLRLTKPLRVEKGDSYIEAVPLADDDDRLGGDFDITVEYADAAIGTQRLRFHAADGNYGSAIAAARTFCDLKDVEAMRAQGLALGGSLDNAIVVSDGEILNEEGLRLDGEFVRHKALDLIGDFYLLGAPLLAKVTAHKPGHALNTLWARTAVEQRVLASTTMSEELDQARRVTA